MVSSLVTVVIPAYNAGRYLRSALKSVLKQDYDDWQVIVVDDCSNDDSFAQARAELSHERVRVIRTPHNLGQSGAMQIALAAVNTPYLVQLDADDWFEPNALRLLVKQAKKDDGRTAVFSGNMNVWVENMDGTLDFRKTKKNRSFDEKYDFMLHNVSQWPRFYLTSALREVGGWPLNCPYEGRYVEDLHVLYRLIERYRFQHIDVPLYNYRHHRSNQTTHRAETSKMKEWIVRDALRRWGDEVEPIFDHDPEGWLIVVGYEPK